MVLSAPRKISLDQLLVTTKDGDWGKETAEDGFVPYFVIRGGDFPDIRSGRLDTVPVRYLKESTVSRRTLEPLDIIIETAGGTEDRPTGRTLLVTERLLNSFAAPVTCASFARFLRVDPQKADPRYVFWFLQYLYQTGEMRSHQVQHTGVARFQYTRFAATPLIELPRLGVQQAIAKILCSIDEKIELNCKITKTLEQLVHAIFKAWFIDFEPVHAKVEGRRTCLSPAILKLFPSSFDEARTPTGWNVLPLGDLCTVGRGGSPRPIHNYMDGEIPWIKIADATASTGPFLFETKEFLKREGLSKTVSVSPGDLILSNSATCGLPIFVETHGCIHDGWLHFKDYKRISKIYLYHALVQMSEHLVHIADGSVQKNLNTGLVSKQPVLVPDASILQAFNALAEPMFERIRTSAKESKTLSTIRDALLPKLISGELRINDAERLIGSAM